MGRAHKVEVVDQDTGGYLGPRTLSLAVPVGNRRAFSPSHMSNKMASFVNQRLTALF